MVSETFKVNFGHLNMIMADVIIVNKIKEAIKMFEKNNNELKKHYLC